MPLESAIANYEWDAYLHRFTNQTSCTHCKREFTQDTEDRRWYPSEELQFGAEPHIWDRVFPVETQRGWFCGEDCHAEFMEVA